MKNNINTLAQKIAKMELEIKNNPAIYYQMEKLIKNLSLDEIAELDDKVRIELKRLDKSV